MQVNEGREIWSRIISAENYRAPTEIILNNMGLVISHINMPRPWAILGFLNSKDQHHHQEPDILYLVFWPCSDYGQCLPMW